MKEIIEKLKNPVTTCLEKMKEEDLKKGLIKGAIISVIFTIISSILKVLTTFIYYSKYYDSDYYEAAEKSERIWEEIKDLEIFDGLIQGIIITAIVIAVIALILLIITKLVKQPKKYEEMLSLVNNTVVIYMIGYVIKTIVGLIYSPLAVLVMFATIIYTLYTLMYTLKESLETVDSDSLVLATTEVTTIAIAIIMLVVGVLLKKALGDYMDLSDMLDLISLIK